jgi:predicted Rossmann-fold nucleotide-binding protein
MLSLAQINAALMQGGFMKIISGAQTGVDRAALDAAIDQGIDHGGWCPNGRLAEDGIISDKYNLIETPSSRYDERTEWNVRDSDATLIITFHEPSGGTAYTIRMCGKHNKPCLIVRVDDDKIVSNAIDWIGTHKIETLNIAGPRESTCPGIYQKVLAVMGNLFQRMQMRRGGGF